MKLIVGLGNPGSKYESTKHNVGFMVIDHFLKDLEPVNKSNWDSDKNLKSDIFILEYKPKQGEAEKIILAKPQTYMNNSGMAVGLVARYYKVPSKDIWIVHDELDLPLGMMKIRLGGSGAGHHGVESIIDALGTDKFYRFRMGIGQSRNHDEMAKHHVNGQEYVLTNFHGAEKGLESSMNQFNSK
jgi:peptidyl-tRNA hydrolase, PTH1 family